MKEKDSWCEIKRHIGVISVSEAGWTRELNLVSWNGKPEKYDICFWDPTHEKMDRGTVFSSQELLKLKELLQLEMV